jgi:hypothetical protein
MTGENRAVTEAISGELLDPDDPLLPTEQLRTAMRWARAQAGKSYTRSTLLPNRAPQQEAILPGAVARSVKEIEHVQP